MAKIEVRLNPDVKPSGSDLAIVNAARRSFNKRSDWKIGYPDTRECVLKDNDKRLIEFLARGMTAKDFETFCDNVPAPDTEEHRNELVDLLWEWRKTPEHDTPFNHCFISFEIKAPIFVARQLVKHEYLIMSEFSRRYIIDSVEFFEPDYWRQASDNKKQGSLEVPVSNNDELMAAHDFYNKKSLDEYQSMVDMGVAPEQARMVLPQSTMTEWTWSGTLGAFAKMCTLRIHPEAQYEPRKLVAQQVYEYLKEYYPVGAQALVEGVK